MKEILMAVSLIVIMLLIYLVTVEGNNGLKQEVKQTHESFTQYIRRIDA